VDNPDVSVVDHPGEQDHISPGFLLVDILLYFAVLTILPTLLARLRRH
jgi:hypothetical protein